MILVWVALVLGQVIHVSAKAGVGWGIVVVLANCSVLFAATAAAFVMRSNR